MWIQDVQNNLVNLDMTANIFVKLSHWENDSDLGAYHVLALTQTSGHEASVVYAHLLYGSQDECNAYLERLTALLGEKVIKV